MESELYEWIKERNIPRGDVKSENKLYMREVSVGFLRLQLMNRDELDSVRHRLRGVLEKKGIHTDLRKIFINRDFYNGVMKKDLSRSHGAWKPNFALFIDCVCIFDDEVWILEFKEKINYEAIGQIFVYKDLFLEDYPECSNVKTGIVYNHSSFLVESVCKNLDIEVFKKE